MHERGFTLMEVMAVMAIIGILLLAVVPSIDNQVPAFRLRAGAREVASTIELAQSECVTKRKTYAIRYDLDRDTYQLLLPPDDPAEEDAAAEEEGELTEEGAKEGARPRDDVEHGLPPPDPTAAAEEGEEEQELDEDEMEALGEKFLPEDVTFTQVKFGDRSESSGKVVVRFSHLGNEGAHSVGLTLESTQADGGGEQIWVKFNPLTRTLEFHASEPEVRTLQPEDGQ